MSQSRPIGFVEFVLLMGAMGGLLALATDAMLPVLPEIGEALGATDPHDRQQVIFVYFLGVALSQVFYGPLADSYGRLPLIYLGFGLFCLGGLIAGSSVNFEMMLFGRLIQGIGAAGPRVVSLAITRDLYAGRDMARVSSLINVAFITAPIIAPALGQAVAGALGWRALFFCLIGACGVIMLWSMARLQETRPREQRSQFRVSTLRRNISIALSNRMLVAYACASGFAFGPLLVYLATADQLLGEFYGLGDRFPLAFASLAAVFGLASWVNSALVRRLGMERLSRVAMCVVALDAAGFLPVVMAFDGAPPLWMVMGWLALSFFFISMTFGNFHALAMENAAHIAGVAASLIGAVSMLIGFVLAQIIGGAYEGPVQPLVLGFLGCGLAALACMSLAQRKEKNHGGPDLGDYSDVERGV